MTDLLKVLDMSEKEQRKWLLVNSFKERMPHESLADLAFRLRDEVCSDPNGIDKYKQALHLIYRTWLDKQSDKARLIVTFTIWLIAFADPIDEIIAALIAKDKEND